MKHQISRTALAAFFAFGIGVTAPSLHAQAPATSSSDMQAMMKENNDKMVSIPMTGKPDIDFAMMMRMHHMGALPMAEAELKNGKDPQMRKMAQGIIKAQKREIVQFDQWLAKHGQK